MKCKLCSEPDEYSSSIFFSQCPLHFPQLSPTMCLPLLSFFLLLVLPLPFFPLHITFCTCLLFSDLFQRKNVCSIDIIVIVGESAFCRQKMWKSCFLKVATSYNNIDTGMTLRTGEKQVLRFCCSSRTSRRSKNDYRRECLTLCIYCCLQSPINVR